MLTMIRQSKLQMRIVTFTFISILITGCCGEIMAGSKTVDVAPLYESTINFDYIERLSDLISPGIFDYVLYEGDTCLRGSIHGDGSIEIMFELFDDAPNAEVRFTDECENLMFEDQTQIVYGGSGNNQYCVSYVIELRSSVESFCRPTGEYMSYVVFQKDRLVVTFTQYTSDLSSSNLDDAIRRVANALTHAIER